MLKSVFIINVSNVWQEWSEFPKDECDQAYKIWKKKKEIQSPQGKEDAAATFISANEEKGKFSKFKEARPELNLFKI